MNSPDKNNTKADLGLQPTIQLPPAFLSFTFPPLEYRPLPKNLLNFEDLASFTKALADVSVCLSDSCSYTSTTVSNSSGFLADDEDNNVSITERLERDAMLDLPARLTSFKTASNSFASSGRSSLGHSPGPSSRFQEDQVGAILTHCEHYAPALNSKIQGVVDYMVTESNSSPASSSQDGMVDFTSVTSSQDAEFASNTQEVGASFRPQAAVTNATSLHSTQDEVAEFASNAQEVGASFRPQAAVTNATSLHSTQDAFAELASNAQEGGEKMVAEGDVNVEPSSCKHQEAVMNTTSVDWNEDLTTVSLNQEKPSQSHHQGLGSLEETQDEQQPSKKRVLNVKKARLSIQVTPSPRKRRSQNKGRNSINPNVVSTTTPPLIETPQAQAIAVQETPGTAQKESRRAFNRCQAKFTPDQYEAFRKNDVVYSHLKSRIQYGVTEEGDLRVLIEWRNRLASHIIEDSVKMDIHLESIGDQWQWRSLLKSGMYPDSETDYGKTADGFQKVIEQGIEMGAYRESQVLEKKKRGEGSAMDGTLKQVKKSE